MVNKYELLLTKVVKLYLTNISISTSNFYRQPKVHKSKQINEAIQQQNNEYIEIHKPDDLTVKPIVGGPACPTRVILKPFLIHIKSYVKGNLTFFRKCSRINNDSTTLVTFDVKAYTQVFPVIMDLKQYVSG